MTDPKRVIADQKGRDAEAEAAQWLMQQGWRVVAQRVKTKLGEIDLIAAKPGITGFFEVKWRKRASNLADAIDEKRLSRVAAAVELVAHEYAAPMDDITIDVLLLAPGTRPRHIENAWMP